MAITREVSADGSWVEKADTPKDAQALFEKHRGALQKRGAEEFHKSYMRDVSTGFSRVRDPSGRVTHIRADETDKALASGYSAVGNPTMIVPELPWHQERKPNPGRRRYRYDSETGQMVEV